MAQISLATACEQERQPVDLLMTAMAMACRLSSRVRIVPVLMNALALGFPIGRPVPMMRALVAIL